MTVFALKKRRSEVKAKLKFEQDKGQIGFSNKGQNHMQDPLKTNPNGFEEKSSDLCPTGSAIESVAGDCLVHSERDNKIETVLKRLRVKDRKDFKLYYEKNHIELGSLAAVRKFLLARLKVGIKNMLLSPTPNDEISQEVAQRVVELLWLDLAIEEINTND